jgi:hypothetical protein
MSEQKSKLSDWLRPPKLIWIIIGLPVLAGILGYIISVVRGVPFPGI